VISILAILSVEEYMVEQVIKGLVILEVAPGHLTHLKGALKAGLVSLDRGSAGHTHSHKPIIIQRHTQVLHDAIALTLPLKTHKRHPHLCRSYIPHITSPVGLTCRIVRHIGQCFGVVLSP
jgi:hypothetical protein